MLNSRRSFVSVFKATLLVVAGGVTVQATAGKPDGDGDIDLCDYTVFVACTTGPGGGPVDPDCRPADFDLDGDVDLVDWGSFQAHLGASEFSGPRFPELQLLVGNNPGSVVSADLDGDGDLDLVTANRGDNNVSVLLNTGNGTFATRADYGEESGLNSVTAADLDDDGDLDFVAAHVGVSVLLNQRIQNECAFGR